MFRKGRQFLFIMWHPLCYSCYNTVISHERGKDWNVFTTNGAYSWWHRYSVTANQVMVATVKLMKWWLQGVVVVEIISWLDLQLPVQSVPITTNVVNSNLVHGSIQHYVIKFVSDMRQIGSFLRILRFPPPINWPPRYSWNIVESGV